MRKEIKVCEFEASLLETVNITSLSLRIDSKVIVLTVHLRYRQRCQGTESELATALL